MNNAKIQSTNIFQFLLVRLRERGCREGTGDGSISIPSGAIKRIFFCDEIIDQLFISIPSGAIKR